MATPTDTEVTPATRELVLDLHRRMVRIRRFEERAGKLVALASSPFEEEARTAAFRACELIRAHRLRVVATDAGPRPLVEEVEWRRIRSKFTNRCIDCAGPYFEGDVVWWAKGRGCRCADCHYRARARSRGAA